MAKDNIRKFYETVATDEVLKTRLSELFKPYQGQEIDPSKKAALVEELVLPIAAEKGFLFTIEELREYEKEMAQTSMSHELDDSELEAVAGGIGAMAGGCYFIGGGIELAGLAWCLVLGISL
jgi:hypothetical protein